MLIIPKWNRFSFDPQFWMILQFPSFLLPPQGLVLSQDCQDMTFHNSVTPHVFIIYTPIYFQKGF